MPNTGVRDKESYLLILVESHGNFNCPQIKDLNLRTLTISPL